MKTLMEIRTSYLINIVVSICLQSRYAFALFSSPWMVLDAWKKSDHICQFNNNSFFKGLRTGTFKIKKKKKKKKKKHLNWECILTFGIKYKVGSIHVLAYSMPCQHILLTFNLTQNMEIRLCVTWLMVKLQTEMGQVRLLSHSRVKRYSVPGLELDKPFIARLYRSVFVCPSKVRSQHINWVENITFCNPRKQYFTSCYVRD